MLLRVAFWNRASAGRARRPSTAGPDDPPADAGLRNSRPGGRRRRLVAPAAAGVCLPVVTLAALLLTALAPPVAHAWKAGGHYTVAEAVAAQLPAGAIKNAMNAQPGYWAYGSYGPDLGYGVVATIWERAPWADKWHYQFVGTQARRLLQVALASGDQRKIAFAAGWLTHCAGDLAVHDMYVNPEAGGVFFDDANTIPQHALLETWADPYCWVDIAGHPESEYQIYDPSEDKSLSRT